MLVGDGREQEVEAHRGLLHRFLVAHHDDFVGTEVVEDLVLLLRRGGQRDDVGAQRLGGLDGEVAEAADARDADAVAHLDAPMLHRLVGGDARAQDRRGFLGLQSVGDLHHEFLAHDDAVRIAAVAVGAVGVGGAVVGGGEALGAGAILLLARGAIGAFLAAIHHAADADLVALGEFLDALADLGDGADDLVAGDAGINAVLPVVVHLVKVRVAHAAVRNLDRDLARAQRFALELDGNHLRASLERAVTVNLHVRLLLKPCRPSARRRRPVPPSRDRRANFPGRRARGRRHSAPDRAGRWRRGRRGRRAARPPAGSCRGPSGRAARR